MSATPMLFAPLTIIKDKAPSYCRLFLSDPTPLEEKNLGRLFVLAEIENVADDQNKAEEIINLIIKEADSRYYQADVFEVDTSFEQTLRHLNAKLQQVIFEVGEDWVNRANLLVGVVHNSRVIFSSRGGILALMLHRNNVLDIVDTIKAKASESIGQKIFYTTLSGEIPQNATVFFAIERILDYLSREKIRRLVVGQTPDRSVEELNNLLLEDTAQANFLALIIQKSSETHEIPVVNKPVSKTSDVDSMQELVTKEQKTEEFLSSSFWPTIKKNSGKLFKLLFSGAHEREISSRPKEATRRHFRSDAPSSPAKSVPQKVGNFLLFLIKKIWQGLTSLPHLLKRPKGYDQRSLSRNALKMRSSVKNLRRSFFHILASFIARIVRWFISLTIIQKIFFLVALAVLLIFAQSVISRGEEKMSSLETEQYKEITSQIDSKFNEAKAAMLYDRAKARTLLIEVKNLLNQIPKNSSFYQKRGNEIEISLAKNLALVNNLLTVDQPTMVLDFTTINPSIQVGKMILLGASIYTFDKNTLAVYRGNLENKGTTVTINSPETKRTVKNAVKASPGTGLVNFSDHTLAIFNPVNESFTPLDLKYDKENHAVGDIIVYGVRLYVLDTIKGQIFRHQRAGEEFGEAVAWLLEPNPNLAQAVSMAIDGSIYLLKDNGKIEQYSAGEKKQFNLAEIDPQLTSGTKIVTDENSANLYILDAQTRRVVVFSKEGKLVAQYSLPSLGEIKDLIVDEAKKKFYVLSNSKVYEIILQDAKASDAR